LLTKAHDNSINSSVVQRVQNRAQPTRFDFFYTMDEDLQIDIRLLKLGSHNWL